MCGRKPLMNMVGMVNPKTAIGARRFARLAARTATIPVSFPTAPEIRRLAIDAGFEVTAQIDVAWRFRRLAPSRRLRFASSWRKGGLGWVQWL